MPRRIAWALAAMVALPAIAHGQNVTLRGDDGTMEEVWRLTSPNAGPADWVAVGYDPPFPYPFTVVSAVMHFLDDRCCFAGVCGEPCANNLDWTRILIAHDNLVVDAAGLTPDIASPISELNNVGFPGPGATAPSTPWTQLPVQWTLGANTIFDAPGKIFFAAQFVPGDQSMYFAVDSDSNAGTSFFTSDGFTTRSSIWSFGNVGMHIEVAPLFSLKMAAAAPAPSFRISDASAVTMLAVRFAAGGTNTTLTRLRVTGSGTANEPSAVSAVRLVVDADLDGTEDPGESTIATGTFTANNGFVDLTFSRTIAAAATEQWLVVYDLAGNASGGQTLVASVAAASDVDANLGVPYFSGAITGAAVTVAGRLIVERGPASMAPQIVASTSADLATLQVRLRADNEPFDVTGLTITAGGSLDDSTGVASVRLYRDTDSTGTLTTGDAQLADGSFNVDDGSLSLGFGAINIAAGGTVDLIVVYDLSAVASGGDTLRTIVGAASDVVASGVFSGAAPTTGERALTGLPIIGDFATIGGALTVAVGAASPADGTAQPNATDVVMLQLALSADAEAVDVSSLTIDAAGGGDESQHVLRVLLWRDDNGNGTVDGSDATIGTPGSYADDDGSITFAFAPQTIPEGGTRRWLLTYDLNGTATGGETFSVSVPAPSSVVATGVASGAPLTPSGTFAVQGRTVTLLGGFSVVAGAANPGASRIQPGVADVPVLQLSLSASGEQFDVDSLVLTAAGSLIDDAAITAVQLWLDEGTAGVRDAADVLLGSGTYGADDGTVDINLTRSLAAGTTEAWLVTYDLATAATPGQTFRASLADDTSVSIVGSLSGATTALGLPVASATHSIGGSLTVSAGPRNPAGGSVGASDTSVPMVQVRLTADLEPITIDSVTFTASGDGNDISGVAAAALYVDADADGALDPVGDILLDGGRAYAANDGTVTFTFAGRTIGAGGVEDWLLVYDLSGAAVAGDDFAVSLASGAAVSASAPSGELPGVGGAPVTGGTRTVLGTLVLSAAPSDPAAATVQRTVSDIAVFAVRATAVKEAFTVTGVDVTVAGSADDVADVLGLTLLRDVDGSGTRSASDDVLAGPLAFAIDDGPLSFTGLASTIAADQSEDWLFVVDLAQDASPGGTLRLRIDTAAVDATGLAGRTADPEGLPLGSSTLTIGGTLQVAAGPSNPGGGTIGASDSALVLAQVRLTATTEAVDIGSITFTASGSGDDAAGVDAVRLYADLDRDGVVDQVGDVLLAGPSTFQSDDGRLGFAIARTIAAGTSEDWLLAYDLSGSAEAGQTFSVTLAAGTDVVAAAPSGAIAAADGAPVVGGTFSVLGRLVIAAAPTNPAARTVRPEVASIPLLVLRASGVNEAFDVSELVVSAVGSVDDAADVIAVYLHEDLDASGSAGGADRLLAGPLTFSADDGTVTFDGFSSAVGLGGSVDWIVSVQLESNTTGGRTLQVEVEDVVAAGLQGRGASAEGLPIAGSAVTVGGALTVALGPLSPAGGSFGPDTTALAMLQLRLGATSEPVSIGDVTISADGSGDDVAAVAGVSLFVDVDRDGLVDPLVDLLLDGPVSYGSDDGTLVLGAGGRTIDAGATEDWIVHYTVGDARRAGDAFSVDLDAVSGIAASGVLPAATGLPIAGATWTASGRLEVALAPTTPSAAVVQPSVPDLPVLVVTWTALQEDFDVSGLTLATSGSVDDATELLAVTVLEDDGDGVRGAGDRIIAGPATSSTDDGSLVLTGLTEQITAQQSEDWLVVVDLDGSIAGARTLTLELAGATARGFGGRAVVPATLPLSSATLTTGGGLTIAAAPTNPTGGSVTPTTDSATMLAARLAASSEPVTITAFEIAGAGSGDETTAVLGASLHVDVDRNGVAEPVIDLQLAGPEVFLSDDGRIRFALSPRVIAAGTTEDWLVTYTFGALRSAGDTFAVSVASGADVTASAPSGPLPGAAGAPVSGGTWTTVGALRIAVAANNPSASTVQPTAADIGVFALTLQGVQEVFVVDTLRFDASGSLDDVAHITGATLLQDADRSGTSSPGDVVLGGPSSFGADDGSVTFSGLGLSVPASTEVQCLLVVDLAGDAPGGGTLQVRLQQAGLMATGFQGRSVTPEGLPAASNLLTIGGGLSIVAGPANPAGATIRASAGALVMAQLRLQATSEPVAITGLRIAASGSGDDAAAISGASLYVDANRNGSLEPGVDLRLAGPSLFAADDAELLLSFGARSIPAGTTEDWLVVYDLSGAATAGDGFSAAVVRADAFDASAPSGPIAAVTGAPVSGGSFTVLGELVLSPATSSPAPATVARGTADVPVLAITAAGVDEAFVLDAIAFDVSGSLDDVAEIDGLHLVLDADRSGTRTSSDTVLAGPVRAAADDGLVRFFGLGVAVPITTAAGGAVDLLVVADVGAGAVSGRTMALTLSRADAVLASGFGGRVARPIGAPISSAPITVGGALTVTRGPAMPTAALVRRGAAGVEAMQVRLSVDTEAVTVTAVTMNALGTGDDAGGLTAVELFADADHDGVVDPGERSLGAATFTVDDGPVSWAIGEVVSIGAPLDLLVRIDVSATPLGGETFGLGLDPAIDVAFSSGTAAVTIAGAPVAGPVHTIGGGFIIAEGPANSAGLGVNQAFRGLGVLQVDLAADNENCTVRSLTVTAAGSIDDALDVAAVRLVRDVNDNGLADFLDVALGVPQTYAMDDGTVTFSGLSQSIGMNAGERWLVVYDLTGTAANTETLRARIASASDLLVDCHVSGPTVPSGAPIEGNEFVIEEDGVLAIAEGPAPPPPAFVGRGSVRAPVLQFRNQAFVHDLTVQRVVVTASVAGVVADTVGSLDLYRDTNQDGRLDRADVLLVGGVTPDASGVAVFEPVMAPVLVTEPVYMLVVSSVAVTAVPGTRVSFAVREDADVAAASAVGPVLTTGAPISGAVMTVAGDLNVALAGTSTTTIVHNDAEGLVALDLALSAVSERFRITSITLSSEGTMDPAVSVAGVSVVDDLDGDGRAGAGEPRLARGITFAQGAERLLIAGLDEAVIPGASRRWLVVLDLAGTASVDQTLTLSLAANVDVIAVGDQIGPTAPIGAPLVGGSFVIGGSLLLSAGPAVVADAVVATNARDVPALQLRVAAFNEDVTVTRLSLRAVGALDDPSGLDRVRLFIDQDADGQLDPQDTELAAPAHAAGDDGAVTFSPLSLRVLRGSDVVLLAVVSLSGAGTAGQDVRLDVAADADVTAFGALSGAIGAAGAPIRGARISLVGALNVRLGLASPIGVGVVPGSTFGALQIELFTRGEAVTIDQIALRLGGTTDDSLSVSRIGLWRDLDGDGVVSEADMLAQSAEVSADDALVMLPGLALNLAADAELRLLAVVGLADDAPPGGTLRVRLEDNSHVRATGAVTGAIGAVGAPIEGSAFTIVRPLPAPTDGAPPAESCGCAAVGASPSGAGGGLLAMFVLLAFGGLLRKRSCAP